MPHYLVERIFPEGLLISMNDQGVQVCLTVVGDGEPDAMHPEALLYMFKSCSFGERSTV